MNREAFKQLLEFPRPCSAERPIPPEIWPDMPGVRAAPVVEVANDLRSWESFWHDAYRFPLTSIDTETSGLTPFLGSRIVGVGASYYNGEVIHAGYWNFRHRGHKKHKWCTSHDETTSLATRKKHAVELGKERCFSTDCLDAECPGFTETAEQLPLAALELMKPVLRDRHTGWQNGKYDSKMFYVDDVPVPEKPLDTLLIAHLYDENKRRYNLDILAEECGETKLGDSIEKYIEAHGIKIEETGHAEVAYGVERPYGMQDTIIVLKRLQFERERWLALGDHKLMQAFQIENRSTVSFAEMEIAGLKIDRPFVTEAVTKLQGELDAIERHVYEMAGKKFDILSNDQLWEVLESRGLKPLAYTSGGVSGKKKPKVDDTTLGAYHDPLCDLIHNYRSRHKAQNTYFRPFIETHADRHDLVHSDFFIHGTVGGRASSREPNLQNITRFEKFTSLTTGGQMAKLLHDGTAQLKTEDRALEVRRSFIPRSPDHSLFFYDYPQMELRVFADYAEEEFLLKTLASGADIHEATAREVFPDFPNEADNPTIFQYFRSMAKQINFGIIYGMGVNKLALHLDVPVDECTRSLEMLLKVFELTGEWGYTTYSRDDVMQKLEDHRVMTATKQWDGLRALSKEVENRVDPSSLWAILKAAPGNQRFHSSARTFLNNYHNRFPKIKKFTKAIEKAIRNRGYIFNKFGRRYHLRADEGYIGVNRLVQGTCADMVKISQIRIRECLVGKKTRMANQVHDEIQVDTHHAELDVVDVIKECMGYFPVLNVPMGDMTPDYSHVAWSDKHPYEGPDEFFKRLEEARKA